MGAMHGFEKLTHVQVHSTSGTFAFQPLRFQVLFVLSRIGGGFAGLSPRAGAFPFCKALQCHYGGIVEVFRHAAGGALVRWPGSKAHIGPKAPCSHISWDLVGPKHQSQGTKATAPPIRNSGDENAILGPRGGRLLQGAHEVKEENTFDI